MESRRRAFLSEKFKLEGDDYLKRYELDHKSCICHFGDKAKQLSDFQLTSASRTFDVNKLILCYQSGYFQRKIMNDDLTSISIAVRNIEDSTMALIVDFLYHHRIEISQSNIINVLVASFFLEIKTLENVCMDYLTEVLNTSNFVTISAVGYHYHIIRIKQAITPFLLDNFEAVTTAQTFMDLDKGAAIDMLTIPPDKKGTITEKSIYDAINSWINYDISRRENQKVEFYKLLDLSRLPADFGRYDDSFQQAINIKRLEEYLREKRAQDSLYIIGGSYTATHLYKLHLDTNAFTKIKDLPFKHIAGGVVVKNDQIYFLGGWPHEKRCGSIKLNNIDVYIFNPITPLQEVRLCPAVTLINEDIYVSGGWNGESDLNTSECYKRINGVQNWTVESHMATSKSGHAVCYVGGSGSQGRIVSFGGKSGDVYLKSMEIYHVAKKKRTDGADMNCRRYGLTGEILNEQIYAIGGFDGVTALDSVEKFERGRWVFVEAMKVARYYHASEVVNEFLYVVGGFGVETSGTTVERYNANEDLWTVITNLPEQFFHHSLVLLEEPNDVDDALA